MCVCGVCVFVSVCGVCGVYCMCGVCACVCVMHVHMHFCTVNVHPRLHGSVLYLCLFGFDCHHQFCNVSDEELPQCQFGAVL